MMNREMRRALKYDDDFLFDDDPFDPDLFFSETGYGDGPLPEAVDSLVSEDRIREFANALNDLYPMMPHETASDRKAIVEWMFSEKADALFSGRINPEDVPATFRNSAVLRRRKNALTEYLSRVRELFPREAERLYSIEEAVADLESSLSRFDYDSMSVYDYTTLAAAIWILDDIRSTGSLSKIYEYLPSGYEDIIDMELPAGFYDSCYENDLIRSVMSVIVNRNVATESGRDPLRIYCTSACADENRKHPDSRFRKNFDGLMSLVNQKNAENAAAHFKEKQREVQRFYLESIRRADEKERVILQETLVPVSVLTADPSVRQSRRKYLDTVRRLDSVRKEKKRITVYYSHCFDMQYDEIKETSGSVKLAKRLRDFQPGDPYELSFALLYLLEQGDDAPWLMNSGSCLMKAAAARLPWYYDSDYYDDEFEDEFEFDETYEEDAFSAEGMDEDDFPDAIEDEDADDFPAMFGKQFFDIDVFDKIHEDGEENIAQIIYGLTGAVLPRRKAYPYEKPGELFDVKLEEPQIRELIQLTNLLYATRHRVRAHNLEYDIDFSEDDLPEEDITEESPAGEALPISDDAEETIQIDEELRRLKKENKSLKQTLSELQQQTKTQTAQYEKELKDLRREHRELADLRELVFNQEREEKTSASAAEHITFPYATKKRTVVFGGHDTFLKAFTPKFTNVKFVNPRLLSFDAEIIRNADIIWIQNNCISHSQYYAIIDAARKNAKQVRYFPYASAEKCAELLVREDQ